MSNTYVVPSEIISSAEMFKRREVYLEYYRKVRETRAFKRFQEQRTAIHAGDMATFHKLCEEARVQLLEGNWELAKPPYNDPDEDIRFGRLGTKEYVDKAIENAEKEGKKIVKHQDVDNAEDIFS